jgi:hypothetical protein
VRDSRVVAVASPVCAGDETMHFSKSNAVVAVLVFVTCLACYVVTLAPSITWQHDGVDSGDLVTAAYTLGVAHPPGYPLFLSLAKIFTLLPFGEIAYRVNLMSAFFAAAAATTLYWTALLIQPGETMVQRKLVIAAASALAFGLSSTLWSQAVIAEVYALHAFLVAAILLLATAFRSTGERKLLWLLGLALGLSLSNHLSAILLVPGTLILLVRRQRGRPVAFLEMAGFVVLGLSVYAYLPVRSMQNPPLNWGAPHTWSGFWWMVSARIYSDYAFGLPIAHLPGRVASWLSLLGQQFTWLGLAIGLAGVWEMWDSDREYLAFTLTSFAAVVIYSLAYNTSDSYVYLIPSYLVFALWIVRGASFLLRDLVPWETIRRDHPSTGSRLERLASLSILVLPLLLLGTNLRAMDLSEDREARDYAVQVLADTPADAVIIADTDAHIFSLWYVRYVEATEPEAVVVAKGLFHYQWYRDTLTTHHPEIYVPPGDGDPYTLLFAFIDANLPWRPIYMTDPDDLILDRYSHTRVGSLYRLGVKG